ncbi:TonB-dependent receptor [Formosa agariphila KMM 3901]|uniref:TonB-dependent receptor n=1 Tax=Formosa agariphila (strain DSM 15362 / KCTC 12365 / LMG 23005 / KMM 3901 / M-2Alg 35-1) TaxID=1347342 RepID=T2KIL7_FORAG|nr:TonB-dependent receptor [Formosa agariphila]CDF78727.1 TonB-dependent receptor [Formosa agariphila KMM 3901]
MALMLSLSYSGVSAATDPYKVVSQTNINQQDLTITGTVTAKEDGMPAAGVNVILKGATGVGAVTDFDGNYTIDVPSASSVLIFSYVGFATQEITVSGRTNINVALDTDISALDEVVVVGYGTATKESLTGSIDQVTSEVFEDRAVSNVALSLQGETPGLTVSRSSARPGNEGVNLTIRGATSVNGGSPLIVMDGAPVFDDSEFFQMNPDDIESISVLKDGAASIYGSRAANGVILVTTKKGKGQMKVEFSSMLRVNVLGERPPMTSYQEYGQLWLDAAEQDTTPNYWNWGKETVEGFAAGREGWFQTVPAGWGYDGLIYMGDADRYEELFGTNFGNQQNLSLSGSSEQARYRLSFGHSESQGALKTAYDGVEQYSVRLNTDFNITEKLNLAANVSLQKNVTSSPSTSFGRALLTQDMPTFPAKNDLGQWYANFGIGSNNSIAGTTDGGRDEKDEIIGRLTLNLNYDIGAGFSANATATYNNVNERQDITTLNVPLYNWNGEYSNSINPNPNIESTAITSTYQTYGGFLNYEKSLGDHNFKGMAGITAEKYLYKAVTGRKFGLEDEGVYDINVGTGVQESEGGQTQYGLYSYLARLNYDYKGKYLLEVVGRRDGSSRFAEGFKFNNYGNVSIGWNVHREAFLENFDALSNLKLRGSYGTSGNQVGIGPYDYVSTIGFGTDLFGTGGTLSPTAYIDGLTTTTRTWEEVAMSNAGIDIGFFNNKLSGSFDIYKKENNGMLVNVQYPEVLGATAPKTNSGTLETTGWEAAIMWRESKGDFSYNVGFNMSDTNNTLVNLEGGNSIQAGVRSTVEGFPLDSYFVWATDGVFQTQAEVDAYNAQYSVAGSEVPTGASALRVGDVRKLDLDGNGVINDQNAEEEKGQGDVKYVGDAQAHYVFGINLGAKYKGFDFTALFQGQFEQNVIRGEVNAYPFGVPWSNQTTAYNGKMWTPENTGAAYPRLTSQRNLATWNWANNDFFVQNNRYIRLKTLVLGYTLPRTVLDRLKMDKIRLYISGNDLFEFTSLVDGFDPESGVTAANSGDNNRDMYPFQRTFALGINVTF